MDAHGVRRSRSDHGPAAAAVTAATAATAATTAAAAAAAAAAANTHRSSAKVAGSPS
jgi:hypothetical protein